LTVNDALLLKLAYSRLAALDSRCMMRVPRGLLIPGLWMRSRLHALQFSSLRHSPPKLLDIAQIAAAAFASKKDGDA
jgi:hypothetical protein